MNTKNTLILIAVVAALSAACTRYFFPRIQSQTTEVTKEVVRTDIKTIIRTVERPDGTKESVTEVIDHSVANSSNSKSSTTFARKDWLIGVTVGSEVTLLKPIYGVQANRRILGPVYVGLGANTNKEINVGLGLEF